ncbi:MAG: hypothetical protein HYZ65_08690 [Burkholderiales bacterium]|nr:hypothetical protein [Burkholderiales bacterium]
MATNTSNDFGPRVAYTQADFDNNVFRQVAESDGIVMAIVGQLSINQNFLGMLEGITLDSNGVVTSAIFATGTTKEISQQGGKKGSMTYYVPLPGSFTMPVRAGETWQLQLVAEPSIAAAPEVEFYWMPDDVSSGAAPKPYAGNIHKAMTQLRQNIKSGQLQSSMRASAQQTIDQRVGDLVQILGDATNMSMSDRDRQRFIADLQKIVCSASLPGQAPGNQVETRHIQELISTFGEITGHAFGATQNALMDTGIRALVQINDNAANRSNLLMINSNINLFIDNVQQVLNVVFAANERRLLTRALVRIVGDGTHA